MVTHLGHRLAIPELAATSAAPQSRGQGIYRETRQENTQAEGSQDGSLSPSILDFWRSAHLHSAIFYWIGGQATSGDREVRGNRLPHLDTARRVCASHTL